ncbi:hypothetical protein GPEL0_01f5255 [Geoanaerobacter pelophilus]|uniref:Addiction module component n=1 Tax=Geoanaerobacter pelophilus TaxID=60036 RepID=A0ABQ0MNY9_9BACT|nr:hypothetical protein [Geoanaerobacter pelophilus]GAW68770.1 hypothetical protein GPEL0_01f5255 [Geoanaerobacter pelophilus]
MDLFAELKDAAVSKNAEGDFPDWLLAGVLEVANAPELHADQHELVELLLAQVRDYDTYAGAGCFDASVTADTIDRTLRLIRRQ